MARILNSPLSAETVTFEYVPSGASTVSTMTLSAANFIGGGSGTTYTAGSGISISANTISLETNIYSVVSNLSVTNTITSTGTAVPTASAVYNAISQPNVYIFDATRGMGSITLDNSKTMQDIVDAYDNGSNTVYIRIRGIADTNQYATYRVVFAYNSMLDNTKCTIYTEAIPLSLSSDVGAEMLYYPALSATGDIFQARSLTW